MVKSNQGQCEINGDAWDVIFELNHIIETVLHNHPELAIAILTTWADEVHKAIRTVNTTKLNLAVECCEQYLTHYKDNGGTTSDN